MKKSFAAVYLLCLAFAPLYSKAQIHYVNGKHMTSWLILGPIPGIDLEKDYLKEFGGENKLNQKKGILFKLKVEKH